MSSRPAGTLRLALRPSMFLLHVPAALAVVVAGLLGQWQLEAWQEHRQDRSAELADADPRPLAAVMGPDDVFPADSVGRPVDVDGTWLPEETVYVADRPLDGRSGFWTVTPLVVESGAAVPVVLGWSAELPEGASGGGPVDVRLPAGTTALTGWLQPGEGGETDTDAGDAVLPSLRIADLLQRVEVDLYGAYVILDGPDPLRGDLEAVTPDSLPEAPTFTALRNFLYGVEWWLFGGFAVFLWWRWTRDEVAAARARAQEPAVRSVSEQAGAAEESDEARLASGA